MQEVVGRWYGGQTLMSPGLITRWLDRAAVHLVAWIDSPSVRDAAARHARRRGRRAGSGGGAWSAIVWALAVFVVLAATAAMNPAPALLASLAMSTAIVPALAAAGLARRCPDPARWRLATYAAAALVAGAGLVQ